MRQLWRLLPALSSSLTHSVFPVASSSLPPRRSSWILASPSAFPTNFTPPSPPISSLLRFPAQMEQQRAYASKLKKYKIKAYSSYKFRFKEKKNGEYKRWRAGKRHNAHSKTNKQLRQLRRPAVVHDAYANIMKRLNFHG